MRQCFLKHAKGIVQPKMKICCKFTNPQVIKDIYEFDSSSEQIWILLALHHLLTNEPSAVIGCRQNES